MSEKYADLAKKIYPDDRLGIATGQARRILGWLDEHPGSCPGQTLTENQVMAAYNLHSGMDGLGNYMGFLRQLSIPVLPEPEPTMAECLDSDIQEVDQHLTSRQLADALIERGWVKATGDDDES